MKFYLQFILAAFILLLSTGKIFSQCNPAPIINFINPSFEGTPQAHITPSPWTECMSGQTPDTQPNSWGVTIPATNGSSYLGLVHQSSSGWQEGASEQLSSPFIAGTTYTFTIDLANAQQSTAGVGIEPGCVECQIWGGYSGCDANTLLWNSGNITPYDVWQTHNVSFTPTQNFTWVMIRVNSLGCTDGPYLLVDNISPIQPSNVTAVFELNNNASCAGGSNGSATVHATGLNTPFTYTWSIPNVLADTILNNVTAGTYTVTVTDANTCADTVSITITQPQPIVLTPTTIPTTCFGFSTGSAYISYAGGTEPYTFLWSNGPTTQPNPNLFAGTYGITATDGNDCTSSSSITITEPTAMSIATAPVDALCGTNSGSATASVNGGAGPFTFLWSNGDPNAIASNLGAGTYTVTATSVPGCTATGTAIINSTGGPTLAASAVDALCSNSNGSATVTATLGTAPYTYLWSNGDITPTSSNLIGGTYTVTVTGADGCITTATAIVNATGEPVLSSSATDATCNGADGSATVTVNSGTGPYTYLWSSGDVTPVASNLDAGTYTVTVTGTGNCTSTASAIVSAAGTPVLSPSVVNATCNSNNGSATATVASGIGPYTYLWSNGDVTLTSLNLTGGTYTVTVTGAGNCTTTASVNVSTSDVPSITSSADDAVCNNNNGAASVNVNTGVGPYSYLWNNGDITATSPNLTGGTYTVTVTDANNCTVSASALVNAIGAPTLSTTTTNTICNSNTGSATVAIVSGTGPYTYIWSNGDITATTSNVAAGTYSVTVAGDQGCTATISTTVATSTNVVFSVAATPTSCGLNNGALAVTVTTGTSPYGYLWTGGNTNSSVSNLASGTYLITVTDATGCSASASASVNPSSPINVAITSNNSVICSGESAQVCAPTGYSAYIWNTGETTPCITADEPGNYYVTVTDQGNCQAASNRIPITVRPRPVVSVTVRGDSVIVFTQQVVQWYLNGVAIPGATSQVHIANTSGTYTVEVIDTNGCGATSSGIAVVATGIESLLTDRLIVYPNPLANGGWQLSVSDEWMGSLCEIFNAEGRLVYQSTLTNLQTDIAYDPARGVYMMRVSSQKRSVAFKLIKL